MELGKANNAIDAGLIAKQLRNQQLKGGTYFTVNPSVNYDTRDNPIDPTKGTFGKLTASPSLGITGGGFAKLGGSVSKYVPVGKSATLAMNVQTGTSMGNMPQFAQYRLGGWNGIRGYRAFTDLGSGSSMLMASAEMRFKLPIPGADSSGIVKAIQKNVKGVVFADVGGVSGNTTVNDFFQRSSMGASVGVGLRVRVPMVGLVRLNYGLPIISSLLGHWVPRFSLGFGENY